MHLIFPDILAEARGLSIGVGITGVVVGLLLWAFGWRWHRFWIVAGVTVAGGLYGLSAAPGGHGHVLALGILLALSAGLLALELARLFAFAAGGTAAWLAAGAVFANAQEVGVFFLIGGLTGILLYRLWTMAATSFLGTLVAGHAGLVLLDAHTEFDIPAWANRNPVALSIAVGLLSALGLALQGAQVRRREEPAEEKKAKKSRPRKRPPVVDEEEEMPDMDADDAIDEPTS
jgi:hypothetical protein